MIDPNCSAFDSFSAMRIVLKADLAANIHDPKSRFVLRLFRISQFLMRDRDRPRLVSYPVVALYRFITEFVLGIELRPKTSVGSGLTIYHGFGLVVNDHAIIGKNVVLRNGVVIGHTADGKASPVIGNDVTFGAGALVIGALIIGDGATVGAGAVVVKSVQAGTTVVGNPARVVPKLE